jgi:hypothetical protein
MAIKGDFTLEEVFKVSFKTLQKHWLRFLMAFLLVVALSLFVNLLPLIFGKQAAENWIVMLLSLFISIGFGIYLKIAITKLSLLTVSSKTFSWSEAFKTNAKDWLQTIIGTLFFQLTKAVGFVLFIIPGIIASVALPFYIFGIVDKHVSGLKALEDSWHMTEGNRWVIFGFYLCLVAGLLLILTIVAAVLIFLLVAMPGGGNLQNISAAGVIIGGSIFGLFMLVLSLMTGILNYAGTAFMYTKMKNNPSLTSK